MHILLLMLNSRLAKIIGPGGCNLHNCDGGVLLNKGNVVMGPFSVGGEKPEYYRAKILSIFNPSGRMGSERRTRLFFIDYGNTAEVLVKDLRMVPPELLECPPIALEAVLTGVGPSLIRDPKGNWILEAKTWFTKRTLDKPFIARVIISPRNHQVRSNNLSINGAVD